MGALVRLSQTSSAAGLTHIIYVYSHGVCIIRMDSECFSDMHLQHSFAANHKASCDNWKFFPKMQESSSGFVRT